MLIIGSRIIFNGQLETIGKGERKRDCRLVTKCHRVPQCVRCMCMQFVVCKCSLIIASIKTFCSLPLAFGWMHFFDDGKCNSRPNRPWLAGTSNFNEWRQEQWCPRTRARVPNTNEWRVQYYIRPRMDVSKPLTIRDGHNLQSCGRVDQISRKINVQATWSLPISCLIQIKANHNQRS